jgi:hypothetical protein
MAHSPELPEWYVCLNCQAVFAGSVTEDDGVHHFHPPDDCAACGDPEFVEAESYVHRALAPAE